MRRWWTLVAVLAATALLFGLWWLRPQRVERTAVLMDTQVRLVVYGPRQAAEAAAVDAMQEIGRLEQLWHPGRPESDLARVNQAAGIEPVKVAPETLELIALALEVAKDSGGAFDPTIGPLVVAWGFGQEERIPSDAQRLAAQALVNWRDLAVDRTAGTLYLARPGMRLELGAIAKGYAARLIQQRLAGRSVKAALVQLGGSVALLGQRPEGGPWQIAVQHPRDPERYLTVLSRPSGFVDTAGDYQRFFMQDGVRYHHILDPRTGAPARGVASVTVIASRGEWADAYATAAFVLGMDEGYRFLTAHGVEAVMVSDQGTVRLTPGLEGTVKVEAGVTPWRP